MKKGTQLALIAGAAAVMVAVLVLARKNAAQQPAGNSDWQVPNLDLPDITFPTLNFIPIPRDRMWYGGWLPCDCGCGANNVSGADFLNDLPAALSGVDIGSNSDVATAPGTDTKSVGPAVYFSEIPSGRGPRTIH